MVSKLLAGRKGHIHTEPGGYLPDGTSFSAWNLRWNSVARSDCGHLWVRRYTWVAACLPMCDHFPVWRRLRPWHVGALLRWVTGR